MSPLTRVAAETTSREPVDVKPDAARRVDPSGLAIRFAFGAVVSTIAGLVTARFGPLVGGLFLAFPAILPASLTLIEEHESNHQACNDARGAVLGAIGLGAFAVTVRLTLDVLPAWAAVVLASVCWLTVSAGLYALLRERRK